MTITIDPEDWKKLLAELVGTFFFFFIGIGSIPSGSQSGMIYIGLAHGLALAIAITALGTISGGHFNPAVTVGMAVTRRIGPLLAIFYIVAQLIGGILAVLALAAIVPRNIMESFKYGTPAINYVNVYQATLLEGIITFFLVLAVFGTLVDPRAPKVGGFGVGLVLYIDILVAGLLTGGVANPARAFAPALISGDWTDQLIWWIGPIVGGIVAALLYSAVFLPRQGEFGEEAAEQMEANIMRPEVVEERDGTAAAEAATEAVDLDRDSPAQ